MQMIHIQQYKLTGHALLEASSLHFCYSAIANMTQHNKIFHRYSCRSWFTKVVLSGCHIGDNTWEEGKDDLSYQSHKQNKFIGSLPVPMNNGLI